MSDIRDDALTLGMLIVTRCRSEGRAAALLHEPANSCPYSEELERAGWLDGWSRQMRDGTKGDPP